MATFYDDLGKNADDLIIKGFPAEGSFKVSTETKTSNGVTLLTTGRRFFKGGNENVEALFEPKFNWAEQNVEVTGKLSTSSEYEGGVAVKDLGAKGTKLALTAIQNKAGVSAKPSIEFKNENVAVKTAVTVPDDFTGKPVNIEASATANYENVNVGSKVNVATAHTTGDKETALSFFWNLKAGYLQPLWQAIGWFNNAPKSNVVGGSFYQEVTPAVKLGAQFAVDRLAANPSPAASVSGEYKYAVDTVLKSKLGVNAAKDLRVGLALQQNWTTSSTVTIGADLNALQLLGTNKGDAHSFGVEIKLK
jgi:hypothetical protein